MVVYASKYETFFSWEIPSLVLRLHHHQTTNYGKLPIHYVLFW